MNILVSLLLTEAYLFEKIITATGTSGLIGPSVA